jgi:NitT/TauT family transport system permease protein
MITATGGAWNASIVSEYVQFAGGTYQTIGLGALIASSSEAADFPLLLASTLTMVSIVVLINRIFWRRLYGLAEKRFHLD